MHKLTIIYDNTVTEESLIPDWGFSTLIEFNEHKILFDAGADGHILMTNMKRLNIDPKSIDTVFMSHHHFDHTGGLATFLHENNKVDVYVPASLRGIRNANNVHHLSETSEIFENIYSSGELKNIEQCLFIKSKKGLVIITGCSHPGIEHILDKARKHGHIHMLFGGLHGFNDFEQLKDIDYICPTHCTKHIAEIAQTFPDKYIKGGVGLKLEIPR